jgi:hypothetical protein
MYFVTWRRENGFARARLLGKAAFHQAFGVILQKSGRNAAIQFSSKGSNLASPLRVDFCTVPKKKFIVFATISKVIELAFKE